jgi:hypothetical protein
MIQLEIQPSQMMDNRLVGQVTTQPLNMAARTSPGTLRILGIPDGR